ncbi:MAG: hypothetical protein LBR70_02230 [Lactobacillaceae bacterium]|jgi:hypothetical protein|nr:hypothetical protein [Lactobacillaceae bacterium]
MQFIKRHWFGLIVSIVVFVYIFLFIIVLTSPRQDLQKRGFIPCTEQFIADAESCKGSWCMFKAVGKNSLCDFGVVGDGFAGWIKGEQSTPWNGYIFEPEIEVMDDELRDFYDSNPNIYKDLEKLRELNQELQNEIDIEDEADFSEDADIELVEEILLEEEPEIEEQ